ncbi:RCC1/BLIP-II protein [Coemansia reversa NRRL 1564]|uniref:RCC1/BLIP-II protein n=1 Tax=Coemansia reversa (strain ATCC 12441 / NRRL 1564) TaxID=763665 RepID=A0A2G5BHC2_COERN|nr:RCC1/BLIP-II protein [Coemansia reversa NRRL 1564]|eukprot:PIA18416.1 RCC1/BLIP-II protein [Coemansia reversa NRRL 1564]
MGMQAQYQCRYHRSDCSNPYLIKTSALVQRAQIVEDSDSRTLLAGFGLNRCYQLGRPWPDRSVANSSISMTTEISGSVIQISCGREHSAMVVKQRNGQQRVFVCGSNAFGQLGLARGNRIENDIMLQRSKLRVLEDLDQLLDPGELPVKVQCGLDHTVILTSYNRLFAMGWGADGQLGTGYTADSDRPVRVSGLDGVPIVDISSTTDFTLALSADNRLFYWGNAEYGQCMVGRKIDKVLVPMQVPFSSGRIKSIAAGGCHALLLTEAGEVYACGYGALGLGPDCLSVLEPTLIKGLENIATIDASTDRCLAIDHNYSVYSWGLGNSLGRLGYGISANNVFTPELLDISPTLVRSGLVALGNDISLIAISN